MSKEIELTKGYKAIVDDEDYEWLNQYNWCANVRKDGKAYALRMENQEMVHMHRQILGLEDDSIEVDHKDRDGLNNQRSNLRRCTRKQNNANRPGSSNAHSKYKGVFYEKRYGGSWYAMCGYTDDSGEYNNFYLGKFDTEEKAAKAYNKKAKEVHGEFAYLNDV